MGHGLLGTKFLGQQFLDGAAGGIDILGAVVETYDVAAGETIVKGQSVSVRDGLVYLERGPHIQSFGQGVHLGVSVTDQCICKTRGRHCMYIVAGGAATKSVLFRPFEFHKGGLVTRGTQETWISGSDNTESVGICYLQEGSAVACAMYGADSLPRTIYIRAISVDVDGVPTYGTEQTLVDGTNYASAKVYRLSDTKAILLYRHSVSSVRARVITVSGSTVSIGAEQILDNSTMGRGFNVALVDTDKIIVAYYSSAATPTVLVVCATVSGDTITAGSPLTLTNATITAVHGVNVPGVVQTGTDSVLITAKNSTTNYPVVQRVTFSGTALTESGSQVVVYENNYNPTGGVPFNGNEAVFCFRHNTQNPTEPAPISITAKVKDSSGTVTVEAVTSPVSSRWSLGATGSARSVYMHPLSSTDALMSHSYYDGSRIIYCAIQIGLSGHANAIALQGGSAGNNISVARFGL